MIWKLDSTESNKKTTDIMNPLKPAATPSIEKLE